MGHNGDVSRRGSMVHSWRALIAVTTCNRERYLRRCLPQLARATVDEPRFAVVVSLDGCDITTRQFCDTWEVPLLYSEVTEGVGISKNRVLEQFDDFDYYFFLEDDVELVDGEVFTDHIALAHGLGIHHMSLFDPRVAREAIRRTSLLGHEVLHCRYGSADFNFFTRIGLQIVGGWHTQFAQYRRWGHTEHSYRFPRAGLAPAPFNVALSLAPTCVWHSPISVTRVADVETDEYQIAEPERALLNRKMSYVPVRTLAPYHYNGVALGPLERLSHTVDGAGQYPLLHHDEERQASAEFLVWKLRNSRYRYERFVAGVAAGFLQPSNAEWRHEIKMILRRR